MNEGSFGKHKIKLLIQSGPCRLDSRCIHHAADCALHFCQVPSRDNSGRLIVDAHLDDDARKHVMIFSVIFFTHLESGRTPIYKLHRFL